MRSHVRPHGFTVSKTGNRDACDRACDRMHHQQIFFYHAIAWLKRGSQSQIFKNRHRSFYSPSFEQEPCSDSSHGLTPLELRHFHFTPLIFYSTLDRIASIFNMWLLLARILWSGGSVPSLHCFALFSRVPPSFSQLFELFLSCAILYSLGVLL